MINTLYSLDALGSPAAFFLALLVGFGFGFALERAGFSSSRRLAGLFYFTDMAVVKVMFTALVTAMLGLSYMVAFGWIEMDRIFLMPTIYGAQIAGGLLFGVGFAMGAWCPGTAVAGIGAPSVVPAGAVGGRHQSVIARNCGHCASAARCARELRETMCSGKASKYVPGGDSNSTTSGGSPERSGSGSSGSSANIERSSCSRSVCVGAPRR